MDDLPTQQKIDDLQSRFNALENLVENAPVVVCRSDLKGKVQYANKRFEEITGYSRAEVIGKYWISLGAVSRENALLFLGRMRDKVKGTAPIPMEFKLKRKDGRWIWISGIGEVIKEHGIPVGFQVIAQDITDRKQLEEERLKGDRLDSLATLTAGIAHDYNNILTGIVGNISLIRDQVSFEGDLHELLSEVEVASKKAAMLTQQLVTFAKGGEPQKTLCDIGKLVVQASDFALHGTNIKCDYLIDEGLWPGQVDEVQLYQTIGNVVTNAVQAMPTGGSIEIGVSNYPIEQHSSVSLPGGDYICIYVQDKGAGIPPEHIPQIFDPYFSVNKNGTGLGLATAYSIIRKHNGNILIDSEVGFGTKVTIFIPATKTVNGEKPIADVTRISGGGARVLVMDDEPIVQNTLSKMLRKLGFHDIITSEGGTAVEKYRKSVEDGNPFDLVILDITVPGGTGGKETIEQLIRLNPQVQAIVTSGYATDPIMTSPQDYGFIATLPKPFTLDNLRKVISELPGN